MVGLPLLLGIFIYVIIILALAIWLKNYHGRRVSAESLQNEADSTGPEKLVKGTINQKENIFENNSQTTLKSGDQSHKINE
jgi:hypothetical protein